MALETYRQLTKGGGLTIPRLLRQEMGVHPGDPLEISVNEEGALVISKHQPSCHICGSMKYIATYEGQLIPFKRMKLPRDDADDRS